MMTLHVLTDDQFDSTIQSTKGLVLIDFWAPWCGPCKALSPVLETLAESENDLTIYKMNVDENRETPARYGVRGIPTLLLFREGELIGTQVGALTATQLKEWMSQKVNAAS